VGDGGAEGVGQGWWGPAVYGFAASAEESQAIAARARAVLGAAGVGGVVYDGGFSAHGARVTRGAPPVSP